MNYEKRFKTVLFLVLLIFACLCLSIDRADAAIQTRTETDNVAEYVLQAGGMPDAESGRIWRASSSAFSSDTKLGVSVRATSNDVDGCLATLVNAAEHWNGTSGTVSVAVGDFGIAMSDAKAVYTAFINQNPQLFYVKNSFGYSGNDTTLDTYVIYFDTNYNLSHITAFQSAVNTLLQQIDAGWSAEQKILFVHDYLITHCEYALGEKSNVYNAYNVMVDGSAVCHGYALAFNYIMKHLGISSEFVCSSKINHAWNLVNLNGAYYYVDCTWDDPTNMYPAYCKHKNLLRSQAGMVATNHTSKDWVDSEGNSLYDTIATGTDYENYYWTNCVTAIPHIGNRWAYVDSTNSSNIYVHNYSTNTNSLLASFSAKWYEWGSSSKYYMVYFVHLGTYNNQFLVSGPTSLYLLDTSGNWSKLYSLSDDEEKNGYLYGFALNGTKATYYLSQNYKKNGKSKTLNLDSLTAIAMVNTPTDYSNGVSDDAAELVSFQNVTYQINDNNTLTCVNVASKNKTKVVVPAKVTIGKSTYKVTSIAANAFAKNKKLKSVVIGKNVKTIGKNAFRDCSKLKKVTFKGTKLKNVGKNAFQGISSKAVMTMPDKKLSAYTKLLKKSGIASSVKLKKA